MVEKEKEREKEREKVKIARLFWPEKQGRTLKTKLFYSIHCTFLGSPTRGRLAGKAGGGGWALLS